MNLREDNPNLSELSVQEAIEYKSITCLRCHRTSYNQGDIKHLFCANDTCGFHQEGTYQLNKSTNKQQD